MNLQLHIINNIPQLYFILFLMLSIALIVMIFNNIINRYFPLVTHVDNQNLVYSMINVVSTYYAVLMGFVIIALWQSYNHAIVIVDTEASNLAIIVRDCAVFPKAFQNQLTSAVGEYIKYVIGDEWELMKWGKISPLAEHAFENIYKVLQDYTPQAGQESMFYNNIIAYLNNAQESRRQRILAIDSLLPDALRFIMIFGAVSIPLFLALIKIQNKNLHQFIIIIVSCILGFNLGFGLNLDYPFAGLVKVSPTQYTQGVLAQFKQK